jgi:hypothetical protein
MRLSDFDTEDEFIAYYQGFQDGIREFAWWKDGVRMVGTCGATLTSALISIRQERDSQLPDKRVMTEIPYNSKNPFKGDT